jgi:hypothetical protein
VDPCAGEKVFDSFFGGLFSWLLVFFLNSPIINYNICVSFLMDNKTPKHFFRYFGVKTNFFYADLAGPFFAPVLPSLVAPAAKS